MVLPDYLAAFICDALTHDESLLCIGRKNGKSAAVAALILAHLCGPLRRPGWRCGIASVNAAKAGELWRQAVDIAEASGLKVEASKAPQKRLRTDAGEVEILPASDTAGAASSYDLAIIDELGLLADKHREFVASMRSSVSAKGGRFLALTIHGSGPFVPEILARSGARGVSVHHYHAPPGCRLDDKAAWRAANPGLGLDQEPGLHGKRIGARGCNAGRSSIFSRAGSQYAGRSGPGDDCRRRSMGSMRRC